MVFFRPGFPVITGDYKLNNVNKKALYGIMLALLLPLIAYFIVKDKSEKAVMMPRHFYADSVQEVVKRGKKQFDTVWHAVKGFRLVNQEGTVITWDSLKGKIVIADLFFTRCPTICPGMTRNMKRMAESIHNGKRVGDRTNKQVHFISFSIDPERDSVPRLKAWADRYQINPEQWWLLTGSKEMIYDLAINELKVGVEDGEGVDTSFIHSDKFILIDSNRHVRGYYDGLDSVSLARLSADLVMLTMEKDPKGKSFLAGKLQLLAVVFLVAILGVGLLVYILRKKQ